MSDELSCWHVWEFPPIDAVQTMTCIHCGARREMTVDTMVAEVNRFLERYTQQIVEAGDPNGQLPKE